MYKNNHYVCKWIIPKFSLSAAWRGNLPGVSVWVCRQYIWFWSVVWCPGASHQGTVSRCPAPGPGTICQHPSRQTGHRALHSSLPPRNYPYQSTWSVSAVLRDTHWALINSGASVNNRWNEPRYVDVDIPDTYFQKQSQTLCMKRIFNNNSDGTWNIGIFSLTIVTVVIF